MSAEAEFSSRPGHPVALLGQAGVRIAVGRTVLYIDPYLSNSVEVLEGVGARRLRPAPLTASQVSDASLVLITHDHLDHCDPDTLLPLLDASPAARVLGPPPVCDLLASLGIDRSRCTTAAESWYHVNESIRVHPVPAAHPNLVRTPDGASIAVGYVVSVDDKLTYHAGDTRPHAEIAEAVRRLGKVGMAFIPVNEVNYYRDRSGIVGNMSIREAFAFCEEIGAETLVPIHWDMFPANSAYYEEIALLYRLISPPLSIDFSPRVLS